MQTDSDMALVESDVCVIKSHDGHGGMNQEPAAKETDFITESYALTTIKQHIHYVVEFICPKGV